MKEAFLYKKIESQKVRCQNCAHYCVIEEGKKGLCGVRKNIKGKLYVLNYKKVAALNIDPIEKKPFFHFLPQSKSLSLATVGCNLTCKSCQNWSISQQFRTKKEIPGQELAPKDIITLAVKNKLPSISYTYTEPTVFLEYALDIMKLAKKQGLKNCWVSNGFMSKESIKLIVPYLDANNIDIKGFSEEFYQKWCGSKLKPILETAKLMKKAGVWVEITTLVIPTLNDSDKTFKGIAKFIKNSLGAETPWHISRFSGAVSWKLQSIPDTPIKTLKRAYEIGKKVGLKYVYVGNVSGLDLENTVCPNCGALCVERNGYSVNLYDQEGKCPQCNTFLNIIKL